MEKEFLEKIQKIRNEFEKAKEEKNINRILKLKEEHANMFEKIESINRKISNYIHAHHSFFLEIKKIEEYYKHLICLIPFFKKHELHYRQIQNLKNILSENDSFNEMQIKIALNETEGEVTDTNKFKEIQKIIFENFEIEKEIAIKCEKCGEILNWENFYIPFKKEIGTKFKKNKFEEIKHQCIKCSLESLPIKERIKKCPHNMCDFNVNCQYNMLKDNQANPKDLSFIETGYLKIVKK